MEIRFETAALVFDDPYAVTQLDESSDEEERWITLGAVGLGAILVVVHTLDRTGRRACDSDHLCTRRPSRMKGEPMRKLTKEQKRDIAAIAAMKDEDIDFSDIPLASLV